MREFLSKLILIILDYFEHNKIYMDYYCANTEYGVRGVVMPPSTFKNCSNMLSPYWLSLVVNKSISITTVRKGSYTVGSKNA